MAVNDDCQGGWNHELWRKEDCVKSLKKVYHSINVNTAMISLWIPNRNLCWVFTTGRTIKETFLRTSSSSTEVWAPSNQLERSVPHLYAGTRVVGFLLLQLPQNETISQGIVCHSTLVQIWEFCDSFFYWHRSNLYKYHGSTTKLKMIVVIRING